MEKSFWKHLAGKQATKERVQSPAPGDRAWSRRDGSTSDLSLALLSLRKGHLPEGGLGQLRADLESWWGLRQTGKGEGAGSGGCSTGTVTKPCRVSECKCVCVLAAEGGTLRMESPVNSGSLPLVEGDEDMTDSPLGRLWDPNEPFLDINVSGFACCSSRQT